jgi:hypothetical protein
MTFWIILILSVALNGALGYWIYTLKKGAFAKAAIEIKEAAAAISNIPKSSEDIQKDNKPKPSGSSGSSGSSG